MWYRDVYIDHSCLYTHTTNQPTTSQPANQQNATQTARLPYRRHAELLLLVVVRQLEDEGQGVLSPVLRPQEAGDAAEGLAGGYAHLDGGWTVWMCVGEEGDVCAR